MVIETVKLGYKQTEIGSIPEDWRIDEIQNHAVITTGSKNTQDRIEDGQFPFFVRSQNVERINTYSFDGEAVLTAGDGVGTGKVFHYVNGKFDYHQRVYRISNFNNKLDGFFFYLYFSNYFYNRIMSMTAKSSVDSIRMDMIAEMLIPLKEIKEQIAISSVIQDTNELIENLDKLIDKKKNIKQGALQELLTGKRRLPEFIKEWGVKKISKVLSYEQPVKYLVKNSNYDNKFDIPVLTANKGFILGYTDETEGIFLNIPVILFDDFTTDSKFVTFPFKVKSSAIKMLKIRDGVSILRFIFYKMQTLKLNVREHKRHFISEYQNMDILLPPPEEQFAISNILSDMDAEIISLEKKRDKYILIKKGMMQQLLTGRMRLL